MQFYPKSSVYQTIKNELPLFKSLFPHTPLQLVLDIGANIGVKTFMYSKIAKKVVAVEPQEKCAVFIQSLIKHFPQKIYLEPYIISTHTGTTQMYIMKEHTLSTINPEFIDKVIEKRFHTNILKTKNYPTITLNDLIKKYGLPDYIKIDTEGSEYMVLSTLHQPVPLISFEFSGELENVLVSSLNHLITLSPTLYSLILTLFENYYQFQINNFVSYNIFMEEICPTIDSK